MSEIIIRRIDRDHAADARLPNEPFRQWGRMVPRLERGQWSYTTEPLPEITELCFPDENYDLLQDDGIFLGAYDGGNCVGMALLRRDMFRYLYLDDLKVTRAMRGCGVGGRLIAACMDTARALGCLGVYTIGQDNNLSACLFYLKHGFEIGGFDNRVYRGTPQEDKANILFYRDLQLPMEIRKARPADLEEILSIYAYAREFMAQTGNPRQWGATNWPPSALIEQDIAQGRSYVCVTGERILAVFYFAVGEDPSYQVIEEGAWRSDRPYGVVHRIAAAKGAKGAGSFCLDWAFRQCGHLRIDTHGDNQVMQNLLKKLGFQYCGVIHVAEDSDPRLAFEKCR